MNLPENLGSILIYRGIPCICTKMKRATCKRLESNAELVLPIHFHFVPFGKHFCGACPSLEESSWVSAVKEAGNVVHLPGWGEERRLCEQLGEDVVPATRAVCRT